ncbi:unnamed protein product, partial [Ixodes pacificus]
LGCGAARDVRKPPASGHASPPPRGSRVPLAILVRGPKSFPRQAHHAWKRQAERGRGGCGCAAAVARESAKEDAAKATYRATRTKAQTQTRRRLPDPRGPRQHLPDCSPDGARGGASLQRAQSPTKQQAPAPKLCSRRAHTRHPRRSLGRCKRPAMAPSTAECSRPALP